MRIGRAWKSPAVVASTVFLLAASPSQAARSLSFQPQLGLPAAAVTLIGAAPGEGAVWATGTIMSIPASVNGQPLEGGVLLRHTSAGGWQIVPVANAGGEALSFTGTPGVTEAGGIVLLSKDAAKSQTIVTRDPGGAFALAPAPEAGGPKGVLDEGESLYASPGGKGSVFTALDEPGNHTGALILPEGISEAEPGVLHFDSSAPPEEQWTREPICTADAGGSCTAPSGALRPLAIAASSIHNAWLLAEVSEELTLFKRAEPSGSGQPVWLQVADGADWAPAGAIGDRVIARQAGQMLTVTSQGVWIDATIPHPALPLGQESADISVLLEAGSPDTVKGTWCYPQESCGTGAGSLGAPLPSERYESFAWPGGGDGTRIIAGLQEGALLRLEGSGSFEYVVGGGGDTGQSAAFLSPEDGWVAGVTTAAGSAVTSGGHNSAQVEHVSASAQGSSALESWPLPFRRPLLAVTPQPGTTPGEPNAQALAVGEQGQIARFIPGEGWRPEYLYNAAGVVQTPRLRGVAWPEPGRAYAVGDEGAMWVWRADTGLWEPDPAEPLDFHADLTGVAFSPSDPAVGYAVGKQGALLGYDKTWTQEELPASLQPAHLPPDTQPPNFTSVAFAGSEAIATYRMCEECSGEKGIGKEVGGLLVNSGSGWSVDPTAQALLAGLGSATVLSKVAGLPDGGAVAAGPGLVIERNSEGGAWHLSPQPLPEAQNIAALAAIRPSPGSEVQALVSIDLSEASNPYLGGYFLNIDDPPEPAFNQPSLLIGPDLLPVSGYLLRQTSGGWEDMQQQAYPSVPFSVSSTNLDLPNWPDAVLALDVSPDGGDGWVVGGNTGAFVEQSELTGAKLVSQSASALRLGGGPKPPETPSAAISTPAGQTTFAVGGNAQCAGPCAELAQEGPGPDAWLKAAISRAAQIPNVSGFLYTGARVATNAGEKLSEAEFSREMGAYAGDLNIGGAFPVFAAPSPSDLDPGGNLNAFHAALGDHAPAGAGEAAGTGAYAFDSGGVRVLVLDFSESATVPGQLKWLEGELAAAKEALVPVPAIVMGNANITQPSEANYAGGVAGAVQQVLLAGDASAYLYDSPESNRAQTIGGGACAIPVLGTGTLGYVSEPALPEEFLGASGFLLVSVNTTQEARKTQEARCPHTNRAPVSATLIPSISQLGLDALDGTLLRRSQAALFQGLARRPSGGLELAGSGSPAAELAPNPYVPIPETCIGSKCSQFIQPSYTFTSSNKDFGDFVEPEPNSPNPRAVLEGPNGKPVSSSSSGSHSGLFCAYNAGTTTVSITTGGLTYSEQVTIQGGSVQQPCGTVPLLHPPPRAVAASEPVAALPPSTPPASPAPLSVVPPPPPAPAPASPPPHAAPTPAPFLLKPPAAVPLVALPLLPPPVLARPIPPSGTSPVTVVSSAVQPEEENEEAVESARNSMAVYRPEDPNLPGYALIALIVIAAGAGAGIRRSSRRRGTRPLPAFAKASTPRSRPLR